MKRMGWISRILILFGFEELCLIPSVVLFISERLRHKARLDNSFMFTLKLHRWNRALPWFCCFHYTVSSSILNVTRHLRLFVKPNTTKLYDKLAVGEVEPQLFIPHCHRKEHVTHWIRAPFRSCKFICEAIRQAICVGVRLDQYVPKGTIQDI